MSLELGANMIVRAAVVKSLEVAASLVLILVNAMAWLLAPFRIGRLLRAISLARMREHRLRTSLTVLGVALGVSILVAVVTVNHSIMAGTSATLTDLAGKADLQVSASASGFDESMLDAVREVNGIFKVTPVTQQIVNLLGANGTRERLMLLGVDLLGKEDPYFRNYASSEMSQIRRDPLKFLNATNNLLLNRELAQRIGARLHDKVQITTGSGVDDFEVWGFIDSEGVARAFGGAIGVMYYPAMQVAFARGRTIDRIDVAVEPGADVASVQQALQARLGDGFSVERPELRGKRLEKLLGTMRTGLFMASFIALVSGIFLVFNTCSIDVMQRKRELGILRALGTTRAQLVRLLTLEGALLGAVGSLLGLGIGIAVSAGMLEVTRHAVDELYLQQGATRVSIDPALVAASFVLGILGSSVAAWFATQRASGVRPVEALSSAPTPFMAPAQNKLTRADLLAAGLLVMSLVALQVPPMFGMPVGGSTAAFGLVLAGQALLPRVVQLSHFILRVFRRGTLGATLTLAIENLPRDPGRTGGMAAGLMSGVALTVAVAIFIASFVSSMNAWSAAVLPGDLFVTSGSVVGAGAARNVPMADSLGPSLAAIDGVTRVRRLRIVDTQFRNSTVKLVSTDARILTEHGKLTMIEGRVEEVASALERGEVLVGENLSRTFRVHRGDQITLSTQHGARPFTVAGVMIDYTSEVGAVMLDRAQYVAGWGDDRVDTFEIHVSPAANIQNVRAAINANFAEKHDLFVLTNAEFRNEIVKTAETIFQLLRMLEVATLLVAALALLTTVFANVMDRVREIGVLRAVGMLRRQVSAMVVAEAVLVGGLGTVAGAVLGCGLGYVVLTQVTAVQLGWYLPYRIPLDAIGKLFLVTTAISVVASLIPARRAANLVVREALG